MARRGKKPFLGDLATHIYKQNLIPQDGRKTGNQIRPSKKNAKPVLKP
jgi:hypothetical protein